MCASITKLNLSLSFQLITDVQTLLEVKKVVKTSLHEITSEEFRLHCIPTL